MINKSLFLCRLRRQRELLLLDSPDLRSPDPRLLFPCRKSRQTYTRTCGSGLPCASPRGDTLCFVYATIWESVCSAQALWAASSPPLLRIRSAGRFRCCADSACLFSGVGTFWIIIMIRPCRDASKSCCKVSAEGGKETAEGAQHRAPFNYSSALAGSAAGTKALPGASSAASARTNVPKIPLMNRTTSGLSYFLAISTASLMAAPSGISGI